MRRRRWYSHFYLEVHGSCSAPDGSSGSIGWMDTRAMTFMDLRLPVCSRPVQVIDGLQLGLGCARVEQSLAQQKVSDHIVKRRALTSYG